MQRMKRKDSIIHWSAIARRHPSAFLLVAQFISLILYAVFERNANGRVVLSTAGVLVLVLVVWVIRRSPRILWISWVVVVPVFVLSPLSVLFANPTLVIVSSVMEAALYFYATGSLIAYMMGDDRVTADELFAAAATFTLLAWGFAFLFLACQTWQPASFDLDIVAGNPLTFHELLYFSFNLLSATGLGDIAPRTPTARLLAMLEQFVGVAYIAVVVSRLIGLTIVRERQRYVAQKRRGRK